MTHETYILRTEKGAAVFSFDSLARAMAQRPVLERRSGVALQIIHQRIVEERVG